MSALRWEQIDVGHKRAKVHGGWIVKAYEQQQDGGCNIALTFVPDPSHHWHI